MRVLGAPAVAALTALMLGSTAVMAESSPAAQPQLTQDEAVSIVLATDPRFEDLPDYEDLRREAAATFDMGSLFSSDYYHVMPTATVFSDVGLIDFRQAGSWLIEATLVRDCTDPDDSSDAPPPLADPCAWRHSWFYRVQPDGTVSLLFDEGDPE